MSVVSINASPVGEEEEGKKEIEGHTVSRLSDVKLSSVYLLVARFRDLMVLRVSRRFASLPRKGVYTPGCSVNNETNLLYGKTRRFLNCSLHLLLSAEFEAMAGYSRSKRQLTPSSVSLVGQSLPLQEGRRISEASQVGLEALSK